MDSDDNKPDDDNWLNAQILSCPGCAAQLFAVDHSPYLDDHRLYCDRCPQAIEIRFHDPTYRRVCARLPAQHTWEQIMTAIEPLLQPCECGGRFRGDSPRRCFTCGAAVPAAAHQDLSPYTGCEGPESRDPSPEEQAAYDRFENEFLRRDHLWAEPGGSGEPRRFN